MAQQVYSIRMAAIQGLNGSAIFTVPSAFTWIVRDIDAYANVTFASRELHVLGSAGQTIWWNSWGTEDQAAVQWRGRQVLEPGEQLQLVTSDLIDVTVSGYQLSLP